MIGAFCTFLINGTHWFKKSIVLHSKYGEYPSFNI